MYNLNLDIHRTSLTCLCLFYFLFIFQLRSSFAAAYGLNPADVKLEFDGDIVRDSDTPSGLGMEDDDIVEAKVRRKNCTQLRFPCGIR